MIESILLLAAMSVLLIGSPGPAAMALAATGASHEIHKGYRLVLGLICGVLLTGLLTSLGILTLLNRWPQAKLSMQFIGGAFVLVMAIRMLRLPIETQESVKRAHFGYRSGILMNVLNPKAYAVFMLLISHFMPPIANQWLFVGVLELVALLAAVIVTFGWLFIGNLLGRFISTARGRQTMQRIFACLMVLFILPMLFSISN